MLQLNEVQWSDREKLPGQSDAKSNLCQPAVLIYLWKNKKKKYSYDANRLVQFLAVHHDTSHYFLTQICRNYWRRKSNTTK